MNSHDMLALTEKQTFIKMLFLLNISKFLSSLKSAFTSPGTAVIYGDGWIKCHPSSPSGEATMKTKLIRTMDILTRINAKFLHGQATSLCFLIAAIASISGITVSNKVVTQSSPVGRLCDKPHRKLTKKSLTYLLLCNRYCSSRFFIRR